MLVVVAVMVVLFSIVDGGGRGEFDGCVYVFRFGVAIDVVD